MELLDTAINVVVIAVAGLLLGRFMKGKFEENDRRWEASDRRWEATDRRLGSIEAKLEAHDARFDALDGRFDSLERSVEGVRSDLTRVALAVGHGSVGETG